MSSSTRFASVSLWGSTFPAKIPEGVLTMRRDFISCCHSREVYKHCVGPFHFSLCALDQFFIVIPCFSMVCASLCLFNSLDFSFS